MKDIEIIKEVKNGNSKAFSFLVKKYHKNLLNFIFRLINDKETVEDIGQEVFFKVYKSLKKFDLSRGVPFSAWLFIIAKNYCINEIRKRKRVNTVRLNEDMILPAREMTAEEKLIRREQEQTLDSSLEQLPEPFRQTILKSLKGKTLNAIAEEEGISLGTVKSRLFRARKKLGFLIHTIIGDKNNGKV